jgi:histidyl-tRNA synthetase
MPSPNAAAPRRKPSRVEPRILRGFQDHLPAQAMHRLGLIRRLCPIAERYGFVPVDTPIVEYLDVLVGPAGEAVEKEIFRLETPEEEQAALRFDLTVPFARLLSQYPAELKPPFRRYAFGPVFRADRPGPGRFRQFTQFDFDHAGSPDVAVDAEIASLLGEVMRGLDVPRYRLEMNSRKLVDALLTGLGIAEPERQKQVLRTIDKLGKVGLANVRLELGPGRIDESGDPIRGVGLDARAIASIEEFLAVRADTRRATIEAVRDRIAASSVRDEALAELAELDANLTALGEPDEFVAFNPALARGLDYYTGPVMEMKLPDAPQFGTVMAGGRYDGLVERFSPNAVAATGASIGVDRLLAALAHLGGRELPRTATQVLVVVFKDVPKAEYLGIATQLRRAGINAEVYFGRRKDGVKEQLSHANALGVPVAVIAGGDELARGEVAVKDLRAGAAARAEISSHDAYVEAGRAGQETVARAALLAHVQRLLATP